MNLTKTKNSFSLFISNNYINITKLEKDGVCTDFLTYDKSAEFQTILQELTNRAEILNTISSSDVNVILDESFGVVKVRSLPKTIKQKDVEKALRLSIETEIGHDSSKYYLAFDILTQSKENKSYIFVYTEKDDIIALEALLKRNKSNIRSITYFVIDFLNGLLSLGASVPINAIYISNKYYMVLKVSDSFIDYRKREISNIDLEKHTILEEIENHILVLGLEEITLVNSELLNKDLEFYDMLKAYINIAHEIKPPYDFDCYIKHINQEVY